jgi:thymidylate kinase
MAARSLPDVRVHPLLSAAFRALDEAGVRWALLRGEAGLAAPRGDVDLLVHPHDLPAMDTAFARIGLVAPPRWGTGAHRIFVGCHAPSGRWVEIDAEYELDFGPHTAFAVNWLRPALRTGLAEQVLARRQRRGEVWVPAPQDEFWALLLHCVVDKAAVPDRHTGTLGDLARQAKDSADEPGDEPGDDAFGRLVTALCPPGWDAARIIGAVRERAWDDLVAVGARLPGRAIAHAPVAARLGALRRGTRRLVAEASRRLTSPFPGPKRGLGVALLGLDGAGKSTLATAVASTASAGGQPARCLYLGLWRNEPATSPWAIAGAAAKRPLRAWRQYLIGAYHRIVRGRLVVFDRYTYDALLPPQPPSVALKKIFFAFLGRCCPPPDLVLLIDVPAEVAHRRRPEEDPAHLAVLRRDYLRLAARLRRAQVIRGDQSRREVLAAVSTAIWRRYAGTANPEIRRPVSRPV